MTNKSVERISLRYITIEDTESIVRWRNKPFVKRNLYHQEDITPEQHIEYFQNNILTGEIKQFIIQVNNDSKVFEIGTTFLKNIDYKSNNAEFGIFIGEESVIGKGYGFMAAKQMVEYAFSILNLNRVYLTVFADNLSAISTYKNCGFKVEGLLKQHYYRADSYIDVVFMGVLKENWTN